MPRSSDRSILPRLLAATATVAVLDLSYVFVLWVLVRQKITTTQLLQSIATGLLGQAAYDGGTATALLGGALHVTIAFLWCTIYLTLVRRVAALQRAALDHAGRVVLGLGYGVVIWWCMDLVVLPLSRARPTPFLSWPFLINSLQHACMIGVPIVLILRDGRPRAPA